MSRIKRVLIYFSVLLLAACTMPETRMYTLHVPVPGEAENPKTNASIVVQINSERYLKQPYIAHRKSPYQLKISRYSRWELPPGRMVRREFKNALLSTGLFKEVRTANVMLKGFYSLRIDLKRFERLDDKEGLSGILVFDAVLLSPDGSELYQGTISKKAGLLDNKDFSGLAEGLSNALQQGIAEVSGHVVNIIHQHHNK